MPFMCCKWTLVTKAPLHVGVQKNTRRVLECTRAMASIKSGSWLKYASWSVHMYEEDGIEGCGVPTLQITLTGHSAPDIVSPKATACDLFVPAADGSLVTSEVGVTALGLSVETPLLVCARLTCAVDTCSTAPKHAVSNAPLSLPSIVHIARIMCTSPMCSRSVQSNHARLSSTTCSSICRKQRIHRPASKLHFGRR
jgi:hypothetical protein